MNIGIGTKRRLWGGTVKEAEYKMTGLTENDGHEIDGHENDGHEIGGQDIYRLKIDYITMQCEIIFKTTAEYKS